jgi:hypothetical protein
MRDDDAEDLVRVGLCVRCVNVHVIENRRGSHFYRCRLADVDPAFRRYPPLPVISCPGFTPKGEVGPSERV